jgi:hypothetical protein
MCDFATRLTMRSRQPSPARPPQDKQCIFLSPQTLSQSRHSALPFPHSPTKTMPSAHLIQHSPPKPLRTSTAHNSSSQSPPRKKARLDSQAHNSESIDASALTVSESDYQLHIKRFLDHLEQYTIGFYKLNDGLWVAERWDSGTGSQVVCCSDISVFTLDSTAFVARAKALDTYHDAEKPRFDSFICMSQLPGLCSAAYLCTCSHIDQWLHEAHCVSRSQKWCVVVYEHQ